MLDKSDPNRNLPTGGKKATVDPKEQQSTEPPLSAPLFHDPLLVGKIAPGAIFHGKNGPPKTMKKAEYLSVMVEYEDKLFLEKIAKRRGVSVSQLTRRALQDFLAPMRDKEKINDRT